jgi:hypothetical protein
VKKSTFPFAAALAFAAAACAPLTSVAQTGYNGYHAAPPMAWQQEAARSAARSAANAAAQAEALAAYERALIRMEPLPPRYYRDREQAAAQSGRSATNAAVRAQASAAYENSMMSVAQAQVRHDRMPRARSGYVWAPGYWDWRGNRREWVSGVWVVEHRDSDHDGVVDAYDRDRDNDGVRNHLDDDRDGDGYRNVRDSFPDDPRRR